MSMLYSVDPQAAGVAPPPQGPLQPQSIPPEVMQALMAEMGMGQVQNTLQAPPGMQKSADFQKIEAALNFQSLEADGSSDGVVPMAGIKKMLGAKEHDADGNGTNDIVEAMARSGIDSSEKFEALIASAQGMHGKDGVMVNDLLAALFAKDDPKAMFEYMDVTGEEGNKDVKVSMGQDGKMQIKPAENSEKDGKLNGAEVDKLLIGMGADPAKAPQVRHDYMEKLEEATTGVSTFEEFSKMLSEKWQEFGLPAPPPGGSGAIAAAGGAAVTGVMATQGLSGGLPAGGALPAASGIPGGNIVMG